MILGKVIGTVWGSLKTKSIQDARLVIIEPEYSCNLSPDIDYLVAVDRLGAEVGQDVIVGFGKSGRMLEKHENIAMDAAILSIVDGKEVKHD